MSPRTVTDIDQLAINTIRFLAVDMVQKANSGHPGAPMGQAAMAYLLWTDFLRHDPCTPRWPNRDRFVLSCGHASALLYSLLHLAGYDLPMAELERFRQLDSKTPGHPEYDLDRGIERIGRETRIYYLLGYNSTNTARDGKFRKIEVELKEGKDLKVRARKGYYAPRPQ